MPRKAEIQAEETAVSSPLRRSSRRTSVNSPAPATIGTRRNSQTQNENTEVKAPKTRRASLSQENTEKPEAKPATRGRRASTSSKEESELKPEPAKTRGRRSSASIEPTPEEAPKPQTVTRRRRSSAAEDPPNPEVVKPVRTRRGSSADKPAEEEPTKKNTRAKQTLAKEEEPVKRTTRSRRSSVDKAEEGESNEKKPVTRGRRSSTEVLESEPEPKAVKLTPIKSRRRPSVTESIAGLEPIEELDSEIKSRHSSSPILKKATVNLSRVKPVKLDTKENLNLSVIDESSFTEELRINTFEEHEEKPRRSPRLNKINSPEKLGLKSSPKSGKAIDMEAPQDQEKEDLSKVPGDTEEEDLSKVQRHTQEERNEETSLETSELNSNSEKEKIVEEAFPVEAIPSEKNELKTDEASKFLTEKSPREDNASKRLTEAGNCNISLGSDGSFNFHLNASLTTTRNDGTENEDLNSSKSSNASDKENVNTNVLSSPTPKKVVAEEKELVLNTLTNNITAEDKNVVQQEVVVARVSNVFRPRMKENSFMEPMEVDECSTLDDNSVEMNSDVTGSTPLAKVTVNDMEFKEPINKNLLKEARVDIENDSVDDSFHLHLSSYGDNQDENEKEVKHDLQKLDDVFVDKTTKEVSGDEESSMSVKDVDVELNLKAEAVEEKTEDKKEDLLPLKNPEVVVEVAEVKSDIEIQTDDFSVEKTEVEENLVDHNSEERLTTPIPSPKHISEEEGCSKSEQNTEKLEIRDNIQKSPSFICIKPDNKEMSRKSKSPQGPDLSREDMMDTETLSGVRRRRSKSPSFIRVELEDHKKTSTSPQLQVVANRSKSPQVEKAEKIEDTLTKLKSPILTNQDIEEQDTVPNKTPEKIFSETSENSDKVDESAVPTEIIEQKNTILENSLESSIKKGAVDNRPTDDTFWDTSLNSENSDVALTISTVERAVRRSNAGLEEKSDIAERTLTADEGEEETISFNNTETEASTTNCQINKDVKPPTKQSEELQQELEDSLHESIKVNAEQESEKLGPSDDYDFHVPSDEEAEETHAPEYDQSTVVNSFMTSSQLITDDSTSVEMQTVIFTKKTLHEGDSEAKEKISQTSNNEETDDNFVDEIQDHEEHDKKTIAGEKPSSPSPKKKSRNRISKDDKEFEKDIDENDEKSSSSPSKNKSKKRISKGRHSEGHEKNSDFENENEDRNLEGETDTTLLSSSPKKKCKKDSIELEDNDESINSTDMKSPQKKLRVRKYSLKKEIDSYEESLDRTNEEKDDMENSENEIEIPKKKKVKKRNIIKQDILADAQNIDTSTDTNNADIEDVKHSRDKSKPQNRKSNENIESLKKRKRKKASKRHSECTEETEVKKKKLKHTKKKPSLKLAIGEESSDEETISKSENPKRKEAKQDKSTENSKEMSPSSKLDEFLSMKLQELRSEEESSSAGDNDEEPNEYVCTMAEEGEEDTPSEDSNAIIDEGESINTTESEYDSEEDYYDESDSFICDEEEDQLLSGEEYDLGNEKTKKKRKSRIIQLDNFDDDVIRIQRKEKTIPVAKKRNRIITVSDSSESEENKDQSYKEANPDDINPTESNDTEKIEFIEEKADEEVFIVESKRSLGNLETSLNMSSSQSPGQHRTEKRRLSSITIHENINVKEIKDAPLSERISQIVDSFCTTMHKGEISMNLSIECLVKDEETSADEKNVKKSQTSADNSIEVFESEENMDSEEGTSHRPPRRLSASMDNIELAELKKRAKKKRKLSKSMDHLDQIETKSKKKKLRRKKNVEKKKKETKIPSEEELRVRSFGLINQLLTDLKNRPKRMVRPSTNMNNSWITEVVEVKPSTSAFDKQEQAAYKAGKVHPKDFRSQVLNDPSRVRRVETKTLLKKKGVYK